MDARGKKWLMGCGIGCGAVLLIGVLLAVAGVFWVRDTMKDFDEAIETREILDSRFGVPGDFTPWPDGAVPPDRMEKFLAVREATGPAREQLASVFRVLELSESEARELEEKSFREKVQFALGTGRTAMGLASDLGGFFEARNQALLDAGMGMGEYTYIYVMAYYSMLGRSPGDGPDGPEGPGEHRPLPRRVGKDLASMMRAQLAAVPDDDEALAAEIESMESLPGRIPWQEGLPRELSASLEPYRERLEASYVSVTNQLELARNRKEHAFSIKVE